MSSDIPTSSGIYRITCISTSKCYIGSAVNLRRRWYCHSSKLRHDSHHSNALQHAWNKYGEQAFVFDVLELVSIPLLIEREQYWLDALKPFGQNGYNINPVAGSRLGAKHSPEAVEKTRAANIGNTYRLGMNASPNTIEKLKASHLGKKQSAETKRKIAEARTGKIYGPETREKIRLVTLGHPVSEETRNKMRISHLGKTHKQPLDQSDGS